MKTCANTRINAMNLEFLKRSTAALKDRISKIRTFKADERVPGFIRLGKFKAAQAALKEAEKEADVIQAALTDAQNDNDFEEVERQMEAAVEAEGKILDCCEAAIAAPTWVPEESTVTKGK